MTLEVGPELAKLVRGAGVILALVALAYAGLATAMWVVHG